MKNKTTKFILNLLLYFAVIMGLLLLYSPFSGNPANKAKSAIQFIYQQF